MPITTPPPPSVPGRKNKIHGKAKQLVLEALDEVGGKDWLVALAHEEPKAFASLIQKLVPQEIAAKIDSDVVLRLNVNRRQEAIQVEPGEESEEKARLQAETGGETPHPETQALPEGALNVPDRTDEVVADALGSPEGHRSPAPVGGDDPGSNGSQVKHDGPTGEAPRDVPSDGTPTDL